MIIFRAIGRCAAVLAIGLLAGALGSCGSGAVSSAVDPAIAFSISPSTATAYSGVPISFVISGGGQRSPYTVTSSNAAIMPLPSATIAGADLTIVPGTVSAQQSATVTVTVTDQAGKTASATITILPNIVSGDITITGNAPTAFPNCAAAGTVCAGQSGIATLTISQLGVLARGRSVRFDVVQGPFQFPVDASQTVFSSSVTVISDEGGRASTVLRANPGASPQIATIRATDVASGAFRTATFFIKQATINGGEFVTVPSGWTVNGAFKSICPAGSADFLIFGGVPPYSIRSSAPGTAGVFPNVTPNENPSRFSISYPQLACGIDGYQVIFTVTDSSGLSIQSTLTNKPGTADVPALPPAIVLSPQAVSLACGQSAQVLVTINNPGTAVATITTSIGTPTNSATALQVSGTNVITITRGLGTVGSGAGATPVSAAVTVGAGSAVPQTIAVNTVSTCP